MTARREFGGAIAACIAGAVLVLLTAREGWARVVYSAPAPLPSGSVSVSGQDLLPAASALALAALACLAAVIATRGLARRLAGLLMAGLGAWTVWVVSAPVHAVTVIAAASGQAASAQFGGGSLPGGNSAISGGAGAGGGLPAIGAAGHVVLAAFPWRSAAAVGAAVVIVTGLVTAWRGTAWPVMSARFDRRPAGQDPAAAAAGVPVAAGVPASAGFPGADGARGMAGASGGAGDAIGTAKPEEATEPAGTEEPAGDAAKPAELWDALDRGVDPTDSPGPPGPPGAPGRSGPLP